VLFKKLFEQKIVFSAHLTYFVKVVLGDTK